MEITEQYGTQQELQTKQYDSLSIGEMDLEQALTQLNPDEISTITLCHSYGFSHQEVSAILDMPLGSVKSNIGRGKVKLREILTKTNGLEKAL